MLPYSETEKIKQHENFDFVTFLFSSLCVTRGVCSVVLIIIHCCDYEVHMSSVSLACVGWLLAPCALKDHSSLWMYKVVYYKTGIVGRIHYDNNWESRRVRSWVRGLAVLWGATRTLPLCKQNYQSFKEEVSAYCLWWVQMSTTYCRTWSRKTTGEIRATRILRKQWRSIIVWYRQTVQRYKFNTRFRESFESVANYMSVLRSVIEYCTCNFNATLDTMLHDWLVCGIRDDATQCRCSSMYCLIDCSNASSHMTMCAINQAVHALTYRWPKLHGSPSIIPSGSVTFCDQWTILTTVRVYVIFEVLRVTTWTFQSGPG